MSKNEVAVLQLPISHTERYIQRSDNNLAEAATEQMNPLHNHRSDENGKGVEALLTTETCTL
jgi:hypothetical protein